MSKADVGPRHVGQFPRIDRDEQIRDREVKRAHQIKFLQYVLMGLMSMEEAARALGVSLATLDRVRRSLMRDGRVDTDDLRKLSKARKNKNT